MLGAIASGDSVIKRPLASEDAISTVRCLEALGTQVEWHTLDEVKICPDAWASPIGTLDCGNSGTTMRLLSGLIASRPISATLVGDASLSRRPMKRIADPLRLMGAGFDGETPPITIHGAKLTGIDYVSPVASAQIKSAILLAGLQASGETWVREPAPSRDHTERMLQSLGVPILHDGVRGIGLSAGVPRSFEFKVPADISSAAFFMTAATMLPESRVEFTDLSINPTRTGILDVLGEVGAEIAVDDAHDRLGEPVAIVTVSSANKLKPFAVSGALIPRLIDEIPVLAVLATQCDGVSEIRDARELRVKESDRIEAIAQGLRSMGASVETFEDGMRIEGPTRLRGAAIHAGHDHRIGMAFAIAGLLADGETVIDGAEAIATSYPEFERHLWGVAVF